MKKSSSHFPFVQLTVQASVVQKLDSAIQWLVQLVSPIIRWIVIYLVDSTIQRLNNQG